MVATDSQSLHRTSQLLVRHLDLLKGTRALVVGYPSDSFGLLLQQQLPHSHITFFQFDYAAHQHLLKTYLSAGLDPRNLVFNSWYSPPCDLHDVAVVFLPKSRALIELTLAMTAQSLRNGAQVFLVGENNAGIRSSKLIFERRIGRVSISDAARHCVLYGARVEADDARRVRLDDYAEGYTIEVRGIRLRVVSFPGVFSHGRLDAGTRFFLEQLHALAPPARVLDFGCGSGVIGAAVKKLWPDCEVDMVDTNALAIAAARRTLAANGLPADRVWPSNIFSDVRGLYTRILSNPPFHTGIETDYRVVVEFLKGAAQHLGKGGALHIVANRFLKYQPLIEKYVGPCQTVAENKSYRIYEARRRQAV